MSRSRLSPLVNYDIERGDQYTRKREVSAKLAAMDYVMAGPVLFAFEKWMAGNPGDPVPDIEPTEGLSPREIKMLSGLLAELIETQKFNCRAFYEKRIKNKEIAENGWAKRKANASTNDANASTNDANATKYEKGKREKKKTEKVLSSFPCTSVEVHSGGSPGGVSAGLAAANAAPPRVIVREYGNGETGEVREADLRNDPVPFMLAFIGEAEDSAPRARGAMIKRLKQLGKDTFNAVAWQFVEEATAAANAWAKALDKYGPENIPADIEKASRDFEDNGGRTFAGRLKMKALALGFKD